MLLGLKILFITYLVIVNIVRFGMAIDENSPMYEAKARAETPFERISFIALCIPLLGDVILLIYLFEWLFAQSIKSVSWVFENSDSLEDDDA